MSAQENKQKLLIEYLISSSDTFALCQSIIQPMYFNPEYRSTVDFINQYYQQYSALPDTQQIFAETDVQLNTRDVTKDQIEYCTIEIEKFCKEQALYHAIINAYEQLKLGNYGKIESDIRDAITISINKDLGLDYYEDPLTRLKQRAKTGTRIPMGIDVLDKALNGGPARGEILLFCANSGGGKSITLANVALNYAQAGYNVLYLSLELLHDLIAERFDIMHTGIASPLHKHKTQEIADTVISYGGKGRLTIEYMASGTNCNQIRGYLKNYELKYKCVPDVLIVDYLDLMGTNERLSAKDGVFEKDKQTSEQLSALGKQYNMIIATASQLNRSAIDADELNQSHTAGGISKVNTVDWQVAIVHSAVMKAKGEIMFVILKARSSDATGQTLYTGWDNSYLRIINKVVEGGALKEAINQMKDQLPSKGVPQRSKRTLLDIMD